jgi:hypothetical protein
MSDDSIPAPHDQDKPARRVIAIAPGARPIDAEEYLEAMRTMRRLGWTDAQVPKLPAKPRRREDRKSGLYTVLHAAQQHGITHPTVGSFLQLPREFDAILALEQKATAQVVLEVLRQTIGTPAYDQDGKARRREWATISQEHFARAGLMTNKAAWRGMKEALEKGYIVRREVRAQRYEYAIRWRGTN